MAEPNIVVDRAANWLSENWMRVVMMGVVATSAMTMYRYQFGEMQRDVAVMKEFIAVQRAINEDVKQNMALTRQMQDAQIQATRGLENAVTALQESARALEATAARLEERTANMQWQLRKE